MSEIRRQSGDAELYLRYDPLRNTHQLRSIGSLGLADGELNVTHLEAEAVPTGES